MGAYTKLKREYGRAYFDNNGLDAGHLVKRVESALDAHGAMGRDAIAALLATKEKLALRKPLTAWLAGHP